MKIKFSLSDVKKFLNGSIVNMYSFQQKKSYQIEISLKKLQKKSKHALFTGMHLILYVHNVCSQLYMINFNIFITHVVNFSLKVEHFYLHLI